MKKELFYITLFSGALFPVITFAETLPDGDLLTAKLLFITESFYPSESSLISQNGTASSFDYNGIYGVFSFDTSGNYPGGLSMFQLQLALQNDPSGFSITQGATSYFASNAVGGDATLLFPQVDIVVNQSPVVGSTSFILNMNQTGALPGVAYRMDNFMIFMDGGYTVLNSVVSNDLSYVTVTVDQPLVEGSYNLSYQYDFFAGDDFSLYDGGDLLLNGILENQITNAGFLGFDVVAVPESSAYSLIVGVASLGFVTVRRRRQK